MQASLSGRSSAQKSKPSDSHRPSMNPPPLYLVMRRDPCSAHLSFVGVFSEDTVMGDTLRLLYPAPQYFYAVPLASCLLTSLADDHGQRDVPHHLSLF